MFLKRRNQNVSSTSAILNMYSQNPHTFFWLYEIQNYYIVIIFLFRSLIEIYKVNLQLNIFFLLSLMCYLTMYLSIF